MAGCYEAVPAEIMVPNGTYRCRIGDVDATSLKQGSTRTTHVLGVRTQVMFAAHGAKISIVLEHES